MHKLITFYIFCETIVCPSVYVSSLATISLMYETDLMKNNKKLFKQSQSR